MLSFPDSFPSQLPRESGARSGQDLVCSGPTETPSGRDYLIVPAASRDQSGEVLADISRQLSRPQSSYYVSAGLIGSLAEHPNEIRKLYYSKLAEVRAAWIADGKIVSENVARQISDLRNIVKGAARTQSGVPTFVYDVLDSYRQTTSVPKHELLMAQGQYAEVIESSLRPSASFTKKTVLAAKVGSVLRVGSTVLLVVDISASAAGVYAAKGKDEQQAALVKLGADVGTAAGLEAGAYVCVALTLTMNVAGLITCGILMGGLAYAGNKAGAALIGGQEANDIISKLKAQ